VGEEATATAVVRVDSYTTGLHGFSSWDGIY
ncbi:hypothetical protein A2U01_0090057, partial [Trifolium medium]|nr:hypothetical protein [Trifolium medium]